MNRNFEKAKKRIIKIIAISFILIFLSLLSFKKIKNFVPPPEINSEKMIGYSQYFGYPLYLDTVFFIFLLSVPLLVYLLFCLNDKRTK